MFDYQDLEFYNNYFNIRTDTVVVSPFIKIECSDKTSYYVGEVDVPNPIHPLVIRFEIPINFPHGKALLWTKSLSGYPHLFNTLLPHFDKSDKDNHYVDGWSWFCLNTPFAETAEEQLNQEMYRLHDWMGKNLNKDLPAIITDKNFIRSLRVANAYNWENHDEIKEFNPESKLIFVGDWARKISAFSSQSGKFHCIKNKSNKYYIIQDKELSNAELPYIIVNNFPTDIRAFKEWTILCNEYNWDKALLSNLLPYNFIIERKFLSNSHSLNFYNEIEEAEALKILDNALTELVVPTSHKSIIDKVVSELRKDITTIHKYKPFGDWGDRIINPDPDDLSEEEAEEYARQVEAEEYAMNEPYFCKSFALGIDIDGSINWYLLTTRRSLAKLDEVPYNLGLKTITVCSLTSLELIPEAAQFISYNQYFGRGSFNTQLCNKKIAIIGVGAIGSLVAESLVRSGVRNLSLWDGDLVEPGNLCRTTYSLQNLGNSKLDAIINHLKEISPFCKIESRELSYPWDSIENDASYVSNYDGGYFYGNVNYKSQEDVLNKISNCDIIIDCTASNELLHFLSYAVPDKLLISLCITNKAQNLLCLTNHNGNVFELRKHFLSKIEQDTQNFYHEGSGCYSPTFLATYSDISALVGLACRHINESFQKNCTVSSAIWSYDKRGIVIDKVKSFICHIDETHSVQMSIGSETILDAEEIEDNANGILGFILGGYSLDGSHIYITSIINPSSAASKLESIYEMSNGIIDYLGDFTYSCDKQNYRYQQIINILEDKASDPEININNPILAMRETDGSISFYLYINNKLMKFENH